ncbi:protein-tyrosine-phosphatase [Nocardioides flavus (ex Wang et al. 2016)]|uniref:Protein-tyrosine-phosphatase n=1 Tax=Nocardioides flavus (ex Wang et al. 2016) TaxID=2058780 RepID=A0ABQ3HGS3_9ACTN|nr:tyrosine-protein phosphatase [Nocardioides flavus (ex Wang et al. 2016)]GHE16828.1 protein-tyrosine-phosphatase [Nocardioides flavus (ex Wang et al. 2016)]
MSDNTAGPRWDGARNLGDLGGLPLTSGGTTRTGRVYRSAAPEWVTDRGWADAKADGLTAVIDLRNEMERGRTDVHPTVAAGVMDGIDVIHAPTEDPEDEQFLDECGPWLDHPRSWAANLRIYPDKVARVFTALAGTGGPVLIHCAGGRDRTGMIGSALLALAGATHDAIVANYESGFRGAAQHRGHGLAFDTASGTWVTSADEPWDEDELDAALADRRPALTAWLASFDAEAYLRRAGVAPDSLQRLKALLEA